MILSQTISVKLVPKIVCHIVYLKVIGRIAGEPSGILCLYSSKWSLKRVHLTRGRQKLGITRGTVWTNTVNSHLVENIPDFRLEL